MADEDAQATMKDLKEMQASLTSLVDSRMDELRELIAQLASAKASPSASSPHGGNSSQEHVNVENEDEDGGDEGNSEGDKKNHTPKEQPSSQGKSSKEEFHAVPPSYSPDPPIPHPHINNIGVPPKIDASSSFTQWQYLMRNYLRSSCNELWRVVQKGFKPHDPDNLTRREVVDAQLYSTALLILQ